MTNKEFCFWLQGYFEISTSGKLDKSRLLLIEVLLNNIKEPLGIFPQWLKEVLRSMKLNDYHPPLVEVLTKKIRSELNNIFLHVIDPSYESTLTQKELAQIHYGKSNDDK